MVNDTIGVVIVTYDSRQEIGDCLDRLVRATDGYHLDTVVVDNGSNDGTLDFLRERHPEVHAIASRNLGYAHGCNLGVRGMLESGQEYVAILFLNPDASLPTGGIDRLMAVLDAVPDAGGVSPHDVITLDKAYRPKTLFGAPMPSLTWPGREISVSDRLHGSCMLFRPEVFRKIGFLDEGYFLYWEELDFGLRAQAAGYKLLICHDVTLHHRCDRSERAHRIYYMWRNQIRFARKNFPLGPRVRFWSRRALSQMKELVGFLVSNRLDLAQAAIAGLFAGLRGETGKSPNRHAMPPGVARPK